MPSDSSFLSRRGSEPLAARMRPATLDEFVGQEDILGPGKLLRRAIEADQLSSIILWGPPGSGKTTLGHVIAVRTQSRFLTLNARGSDRHSVSRAATVVGADLSRHVYPVRKAAP